MSYLLIKMFNQNLFKMRKLTLIASLVFVVGFAFGQSNESQVLQVGAGNIATVKQIGVGNDAFLQMVGDYNTIYQCQTGFFNSETFVIDNGDFNATYDGVAWTPWNSKFFIKKLYDPSNTQHQFGEYNHASVYMSGSDGNLVSQTQGWKYIGSVWGIGNVATMSFINSDGNRASQAQLFWSNTADISMSESDGNIALQYQKGYANTASTSITGGSDNNMTSIVQGWHGGWSEYNNATVSISDFSDGNEAIINQKDAYNEAQVLIWDNSSLNKAAIYQEGQWSFANISMYSVAYGNEMSICQWDQGNHYAAIDVFKGDFNKIYDGVSFAVPSVFGNKVYTEVYWDPTNVIHQDGMSQIASISIGQNYSPMEADYNKVSIYQYGSWSYGNEAYIDIWDGSFNRVALYQEGEYHDATVNIWNDNSDDNMAFIAQHEHDNNAMIQITNNSEGNKTSIVQGKNGNGYLDAHNDAYIYVDQHDDGVAVINQYRQSNLATITLQVGAANWAAIYQNSVASFADIYVTGIGNMASICQHDYGFHTASIYINGNGNGFNTVTPYAPGSPYFVPSNPGYSNGYTFKVDNFLCYDPTNMIRQEGLKQLASMSIVGNGNFASIYQKGYNSYGAYNHYANLDIWMGDGNLTAQYQDGMHNSSYIDIDYANDGKALTFQIGQYNVASIYQYNGQGNMAGIDQFGHSHHGSITQTGAGNEATINQFDY